MTIQITAAQIRKLSIEAAEAGDLDQVAVCERALTGDVEAQAECQRVIEYAAGRAADDN